MATARVAAGSLFDSVTAAGSAVTETFNVVGDSVQMLSAFVRKHKAMQSMSITMELADYETNLIRQSTLEDFRQRKEIEKFIAENPTYGVDFEKELLRRKKLLRGDENSNTQN